jgi:oxygen-independent coproporphyrinogen-3 oxidase
VGVLQFVLSAGQWRGGAGEWFAQCCEVTLRYRIHDGVCRNTFSLFHCRSDSANAAKRKARRRRGRGGGREGIDVSALRVDLDLIRKYNVAAPRYTSYPPATHFTSDVPLEEAFLGIRQNNTTCRDLSLYVHLPFCRSLCWYCGCTTVITTDQSRSALYLEYLKKELALVAALINRGRKVVQIHLGGGTPTFLLPEEIRALGRMIREQFVVAREVEAGVEIDPRRVTAEHLEALRDAGFRRASIGVQDHDPTVQRAIHRIQPPEVTARTVRWLREAGFESINLDLIYGLPHQTPSSFEKTLLDVMELHPDRLAVFSYAHVPWLKPAQRSLEAALPSAETKLEILKLTIETLTAAGYVYIGMDHFAREGDELAVAQRGKTLTRNFQGYSTHGDADIYAFGMSSISQVGRVYWQNHKELPRYCESLDDGKWPIAKGYLLTEDDRIRRDVIVRLMCDLGLNFEVMSDRLGVRFTDYFAEELASLDDLEAHGLIESTADGIAVTDLGRLLIRNIAVRFDAYAKQRTAQRFSKAI